MLDVSVGKIFNKSNLDYLFLTSQPHIILFKYTFHYDIQWAEEESSYLRAKLPPLEEISGLQ